MLYSQLSTRKKKDVGWEFFSGGVLVEWRWLVSYSLLLVTKKSISSRILLSAADVVLYYENWFQLHTHTVVIHWTRKWENFLTVVQIIGFATPERNLGRIIDILHFENDDGRWWSSIQLITTRSSQTRNVRVVHYEFRFSLSHILAPPASSSRRWPFSCCRRRYKKFIAMPSILGDVIIASVQSVAKVYVIGGIGFYIVKCRYLPVSSSSLAM